MVPESGVSWPSSSFRNVDLPAPLGPIRPTRSPSEMPIEMRSNKRRAPCDLLMAWQLRINAMNPTKMMVRTSYNVGEVSRSNVWTTKNDRLGGHAREWEPACGRRLKLQTP